MRLKIREVNFSNDKDWLFRLENDSLLEYYIMSEPFYKKNNLKSPITKLELDYFDEGHSILCRVKELNGVNIITEII